MSDTSPIGHTITINRTFSDTLSPQELRTYVDAIVTTSRAERYADTDAAAEALTRALADAGFDIAPVEARNMAEHFVGDEVARLTIVDSAGNILHNQSGAAARPAGQASDPDTERPFFS